MAATNSVYALEPLGRIVGRYDKAHLVPYGEYLPMRPVLSAIGLSRLAPGDLDFAAGPGPRTIRLPRQWGEVGFQLCYEIIFSGEVVDPNNRPDFIFNPSNDAWFGRWGPPQHLAQARLRAAEEGLPVVRSTPTGISALIDPHGRVLQSIPWQQAGIIDATLPDPLEPTLFARFGNLIPLVLGFLLIAAAIALSRRSR
jgi:apolipoprotein N-acyltransferase